MTDNQRFQHGGVIFPLATPSTNTLLRDADPALFYLLEFFASVLSTHISARLLAAATASGATQVTTVLSQSIPFNPEPFLTQDGLTFPLLAAYRKNTEYRYLGHRKIAKHQIEVAYVLPPMRPSEAEAILPALHAVEALLDNRTEQGFDPSYTPSSPTGTAGEKVWAAARAGLSRIEVLSTQTGGYQPTEQLYFPAVILAINAEERSDPVTGDLESYEGADTSIDHTSADGTQVPDFVQTSTYPAPTVVSCSPNTGTKQGGTPVTVTVTGAVPGTTPRMLFGGADASNVVVVNATTVTCVTPAHDAFPTFAADVTMINPDTQAHTLTTGYTFTSP